MEIRNVQTDLDKRRALFADDEVQFDCEVFLGGVDPKLVEVQVYYGLDQDGGYELQALDPAAVAADGVVHYSGAVRLRPSGAQELDVRLAPVDPAVRALYPELLKWAP